MMSYRVVFVALVSALLLASSSMVAAVCSGTSPQCSSFSMTTPSGDISLILTYDPSSGDVCTLSGTLTDSSLGGGVAAITSLSSSGAPNTLVVGPVSGTEEVISVNVAFMAAIPGGTSTMGTLNGPIAAGGASLTFTPLFGTTTVTTGAASPDECFGGATGDPLFTGFRGQQFYVEGVDGQVFNMLSTFNMQLNGRFLNMEEGRAMLPFEQDKVRLLSEVRHQQDPSVAAFPKTTPWSHPGNYFGEAGVALLDNNRVYAKAGSYEKGFAKVTLNGRPMPVSDDFVVLGQGANMTFIQRTSAHEIMVRTVNVEFTLVNSDNFLNVEHIHLERGFKTHNKFSGMLGHTVDNKWTWDPKAAQEAVVQSNDLFELTPVEV